MCSSFVKNIFLAHAHEKIWKGPAPVFSLGRSLPKQLGSDRVLFRYLLYFFFQRSSWWCQWYDDCGPAIYSVIDTLRYPWSTTQLLLGDVWGINHLMRTAKCSSLSAWKPMKAQKLEDHFLKVSCISMSILMRSGGTTVPGEQKLFTPIWACSFTYCNKP